MLDPSHPLAPKYWMHETSGELRPAIEALLNQQSLTVRQIALIRAYLRQWIMSPVWDANTESGGAGRRALASLRREIDALTTADAIHRWLQRALIEGHDPL